MKLLDRYVIRQFVSHFLLILAALTGIYLLIDIFEKLDRFREQHLAAGLAARYFFTKIPLIYDQLAPVCLLLAGIVTLGLLMNRNEMQTLNSAGISRRRIMRPFFGAAVLLTFFSVAVAQWVVPPSGQAVSLIWRQHVLKQKNLGTVRQGITFFRGRRGIYAFKANRGGKPPFSSFRYIAFDNTGRQEMLIYAGQADWTNNKWHFSQGQVVTDRENGNFSAEPFDELSLALPEKPADMSAPVQDIPEIKLTAMLHAARNAPDGAARRIALREAHRRFSFLFLGLPLLILALPLLFRFHRYQGGINLALAVPVSAGLAFCAWAAWSGLQAVAQTHQLTPLVASWSIHLGCIVSGVLLQKILH